MNPWARAKPRTPPTRSLVRRLRIVDHFGTVTELNFTNIRLNQPVDREIFKFTPPVGTEIVKQ